MPPGDPTVIVEFGPLTVIRLNRPQVINSLDLGMVRLIREALEHARALDACRCVLLTGAGERGFCAGGDIKALWELVRQERFGEAEQFFQEEYALDLSIHTYPKPVIVLADGITMGGGIGLAAGASLVIATERTRMAMPETRIGFFPDVGATGWMHTKCPPGYPAFLGLTGYAMNGGETVRLGLATHLIPAGMLGNVVEVLKRNVSLLPEDKNAACDALHRLLAPYDPPAIPRNHAMDAWVATHFDEQPDIEGLIEELRVCHEGSAYCPEFLRTLNERSPTALKLTHALLRHNRGRSLPEVFSVERLAAAFIIRHPDYSEGVRARVIDKDDAPHWRPETLAEVGEIRIGDDMSIAD